MNELLSTTLIFCCDFQPKVVVTGLIIDNIIKSAMTADAVASSPAPGHSKGLCQGITFNHNGIHDSINLSDEFIVRNESRVNA